MSAQNDPRFKKVFSDPKYRPTRKSKAKVAIDDRFKKEDLVINKSTSKVDKYGRKKKSEDNDATKAFDELYEKQQDEENEEKEAEEEKAELSSNSQEPESELELESASDSESDSNSDSELENENIDDILAKARGLASDESSDESDSEAELAESVSEDEDAETAEAIPEADPTHRFAAVNLDWDHLSATSLFATFASFLPPNTNLTSVQIFKSEYGKEKLAQEELHGPPAAIFNGQDNNSVDSNSDSDSDSDDENLDIAKATRKLYKESDESELNTTALREYQLDRLRFYYAIVTFPTTEIAQNVYKACDSTEYESTGNFFDLRYVPDEMEFEADDMTDKCTSLPLDYKPIEFATDALRSSKPKLTWDETPVERVEFVKRAFKSGELEDMDFKAYLASDSEDEQADENVKDKYKNLVSGLLGKKDESVEVASDDEDEGDVDMEITFTPGLSTSKSALASSASTTNSTGPDGESTIDKIKRKEKERKKARKEKIKQLKQEQLEQKRSDKKARRAAINNNDNNLATKSELEQESDDDEPKHFSQKDIKKLQKLEKKKKKSAKEKKLEEELKSRLGDQDKIEADDRFTEIFEGHEFVGGSEAVKKMRNEYKRKKNQRDDSSDNKLDGLVQKIKRRKN